MADRRVLGPAEARIMSSVGVILLLLTVAALLRPRWVVIPFAVLTGWVAISLFIRSYKLQRKRRTEIGSLAMSGRTGQR